MRGLEPPLPLVIAEDSLSLDASLEPLHQRFKRLTFSQYNLHRISLRDVRHIAGSAGAGVLTLPFRRSRLG
jgi:hypothetical protein